jgi:cell wall-associated NlpC family hydrolase
MKNIGITALALWAFLPAHCQPCGEAAQSLPAAIESLRKAYAPDDRVAVFDVTLADSTLGGYVYGGFDYRRLTEEVQSLGYRNQTEELPAKELGTETYAIVNLSVADMRVGPHFEDEMATQALLGTPLRVLQRKGRSWYRVQNPDGYIAWITAGSLKRMAQEDLRAWNRADKIIFTSYFGFSYEKPDASSQTVSDLVAGNMLRVEGKENGFYKVAYPDGRQAYVCETQCEPFGEWCKRVKLTGENLVKTAFGLMGLPYNWGGTSVKGVDCSGLVRTAAFINGAILPRDASQQAHAGIPVDISTGYENLQPGDLMFFGTIDKETGEEHIRHVAFYVGGNRFIHASSYVRVNSLMPESPDYDETNSKEFIRAARIAGLAGKPGSRINLIGENHLYKP